MLKEVGMLNYFNITLDCLGKVGTSVTRFCEISPLWHNFKVLGKFLCVFSIWQNVDPTLAKMSCYWANLHCWRWPNILKQFIDLVTLVGTLFQHDLRLSLRINN